LSRVHQTRAGFGFSGIDEGYRLAREAAERARDLDPDLAEAHLALGLIAESHDWNWKAADASFRRALELAPGDAHIVNAAAGLERVLGRIDRALELAGRAIALDPLSGAAQRQAGLLYLIADRLDDAAASFKRALDLSPGHGFTHAVLAITELLRGHSDAALPLAQAEQHGVFRNLALSLVHHALGNSAAAGSALDALRVFGWTAAYQMAEAHAWRNEVDAAFEWLERAYAQRDPGVIYTATDPLLRPLEADPRWQPFLSRLNLA
jgi:tetratricopeptide (TPR) repeat protein